MPKLYSHMAKIMFKPTKGQQDAPNKSAPGRIGLLVGYVTLSGGAWDGPYKCVDLRDFEDGASRNNARIWIAKTVSIPWASYVSTGVGKS